MQNNNSGFEFLDFITIAAYLMAADNLETTDNFRDKVYAQLNRMEKKIDKIWDKINKE